MNFYRFREEIENRNKFQRSDIKLPRNLSDCSDRELNSYLRVVDRLHKIKLLTKYKFYSYYVQPLQSDDKLTFINKELIEYTPICKIIEQHKWFKYTANDNKYNLSENETIFENTIPLYYQEDSKVKRFLDHLILRMNYQLKAYGIESYYKIIPNDKDQICWVIIMVKNNIDL